MPNEAVEYYPISGYSKCWMKKRKNKKRTLIDHTDSKPQLLSSRIKLSAREHINSVNLEDRTLGQNLFSFHHHPKNRQMLQNAIDNLKNNLIPSLRQLIQSMKIRCWNYIYITIMMHQLIQILLQTTN